MKNKLFNLIVGLSLLAPVSQTYAIAVSYLELTDFNLINASGDIASLKNKTINSPIYMDVYQDTLPMVLDPNSLLSNGIVSAGIDVFWIGAVTLPDFYSNWNTPVLSGYSPLDTGVYSAPSGDLTNDILTLDLSSWSSFFVDTPNLVDVSNAGSYSDYTENTLASTVRTTYDPVTAFFTAEWDTQQRSGRGPAGSWQIEGYVHTVPLPAPLVLLLTGMLGLFGVARRNMAEV